MINTELLLRYCEEFELPMTEEAAQKLDCYARLLVEWNEKVNLTAITQPDEIVVKHFIDSLLLFKAVDIPHGSSLIDVGTGAGFPSLPVKIIRDDIHLTLLDSLQKRLNFLHELCNTLGVKSSFSHARAEDGGQQKELREQFDFACARAVASLRLLSEYCLPYVKVGGGFLALKGGDPEEELAEGKNAISTMGGRVEDVKKFILPDDSRRTIILIRKISQTPPQFPRNSAKIAKKPII